jgi:hypothetical protein
MSLYKIRYDDRVGCKRRMYKPEGMDIPGEYVIPIAAREMVT